MRSSTLAFLGLAIPDEDTKRSNINLWLALLGYAWLPRSFLISTTLLAVGTGRSFRCYKSLVETRQQYRGNKRELVGSNPKPKLALNTSG